MALETGNTPNLETGGTNQSDQANDAGKILLADAGSTGTGGIGIVSAAEAATTNSSSVKPAEALESCGEKSIPVVGTPSDVWTLGGASKPAATFGAVGGITGLVWPLIPGTGSFFERRHAVRTVNEMLKDPDSNLLARRQSALDYVKDKLNALTPEEQIKAAHTDPAKNGLLKLFAPHDNLNATDQQVAQFLNAGRDQILDPMQGRRPFLSDAQNDEIDSLRKASSDVKEKEILVERANAFLALDTDAILRLRTIPPVVAADPGRLASIEQIRLETKVAEDNEQWAREANSFVNSTADQITTLPLPSFLKGRPLQDAEDKVKQIVSDRATQAREEREVQQIRNDLRQRGLSDGQKDDLNAELRLHQGLADDATNSITNVVRGLKTQMKQAATKYTKAGQGARGTIASEGKVLQTSLESDRDNTVSDIRAANKDMDQRLGILISEVRTDHNKFIALREKIINVDQADIHRLRLLEEKLNQNKMPNKSLAEVLHNVPSEVKDASGSEVRISDETYKRFTRAFDLSGMEDGSTRSIWQRLHFPNAGAALGRTGAGIGIGALSGVALYSGEELLSKTGSAIFSSSPEERAKSASECQANNADEILQSGSFVPTSVTGGKPEYILTGDKEKTYDFGSQALAAIRKEEIDARLDNLKPDEQDELLQRASQQRAQILESSHDMAAIEYDLSTSPVMKDQTQRIQMGKELGKAVEAANNAQDQLGLAKAYRDNAVWDMAYIDAINNHRITGITDAVVEDLKKAVQYELVMAASKGPGNPDLLQLQQLAREQGIEQ